MHKFEPGPLSWYYLIFITGIVAFFIGGMYFTISAASIWFKDNSVVIICDKYTDKCSCNINGDHPSNVQLNYCHIFMRDMMNITWERPSYYVATGDAS